MSCLEAMADAFQKLMAVPARELPPPVPISKGKNTENNKRRGDTLPLDESGPSKLSKSTEQPHSAPSPTYSAAKWLNSLSGDEARALDTLMRRSINVRASSPLDVELLRQLRSLRGATLPGGVTTHSGAWWADRLQCELVTGIKIDGDHPRWQIDVEAKGGVAVSVKKVVSAAAYADFLLLASVGKKKMVKLNCHHVALNADIARRDIAPLPLDAGRGGSVSHLCDRIGCVGLSHLEVSTRHMTNTDRQRCQGPVLCVYRGQIVSEQACTHAKGDDDSELKLLNSCMGRITLITLSDAAAEHIANSFGGL